MGEKMSRDEKRFAVITACLAAASILLAPLFSALVVRYELARSQSYYFSQRAFERSEAYLDRSLDLAGELNNRLLRLEILAKEIKLDSLAAASRAALNRDLSAAGESLNDKLVRYHLELYEYAGRAEFGSYLFAEEVRRELQNVATALEANFATGRISPLEVMQRVAGLSDEEASLVAAELLAQTSVETSDDLVSARAELVAAMYRDIFQRHGIYAGGGS